MTRKLFAALVTLLAVFGAVAGAGRAAAEPRPSSDLLLPYFEVDLEAPGTATTLFAVVNSLKKPVPVSIEVRTDWGIPVLQVALTLEPGQVRTVNLRDWLGAGKLPNRTLAAPDLSHLAAALSGRRSPKDSLYYSTEAAPGRAVGSVVIRTQGPDFPNALWGDYIYIDPVENLSSGDSLVDIARSHCPGLCTRHALRFLAGAAFDAGTELVFWTDKTGHPSADPQYPYADQAMIETTAYDEAGKVLDGREVDALPTEIKKVKDLALAQPFGWLELRTEQVAFFGVRYSANGRYSVAFQSWCLPEELSVTGPAIRITKLTNEQTAAKPPGPSIAVGAPVTWSYIVANTGDVALSNVRVTDDQGVAVSCPRDVLAVGASMTCTGRGVAQACQYSNIGTATGTPPSGPDVSSFDISHYFGVVDAKIDVELSVEGQDADDAPGPTLKAGSTVHWTYQVRNTGDAELTGIAVKNAAGAAVTCPKATLKAGESMTCNITGTATLGSHSEMATASGQPPCGNAASDSDPAHYTAGDPPHVDIRIKKATNGEDADAAPGPEITVGGPVTWTYVVTNTGEVPLSNVKVTDSKGVAVSCPKTTLAAGESMTCTGNGTAVAGQYENIGSVTGNPPSGPPVTASDPSHYYGKTPPPNTGCEGCSLGYWKNHTNSWAQTGYSTSQKVQDVFSAASSYSSSIRYATLLEGLSFQGGSDLDGAAGNLLRQAVAALLNAAHPSISYPRSKSSVIADVNAALASKNRDKILDLAGKLDHDNTLSCPLH